jgi:methionyl-tRNA formyltransferase
MGLPTWPAKSVKDPGFAEQVRAAEVDLLLNVHSLYVIAGEVVAAPRLGSFNLHPGPLPQYAGLNTVSWALYRGEAEYGVTVHKMAPGIDTGAIAYQSLFPIEDKDTALSLYAKCIREGLELLSQLVEAAAQGPGAIPLREQDLSQRRYFGKEVPQNGLVQWARPAREVVNFVRACDYFPFPSPWGSPKARLGDTEVGLIKAARTGRTATAPPGSIGDCSEMGAEIACGDEWILCQRVTLDGRALHPGKLWARGKRLSDGI